MILFFPRSYKISVEQRPTVTTASLLSPVALAFFREISRKKVRLHPSHYLLCQISMCDIYLYVTQVHMKCDEKRCREVVHPQESLHQGLSRTLNGQNRLPGEVTVELQLERRTDSWERWERAVERGDRRWWMLRAEGKGQGHVI